MRLEDRLVDRVGQAVAQQTGAMLLVANAPRAMIDLNRAPDDIDWEMFERAERPQHGNDAPTQRARNGLGLIPRRVPGVGELWKEKLSREDLTARITGIHDPYHAAIARTLAELQARWGAAVLLDLHSMPTIRLKGAALPPEFVLGDKFGGSCHGSLAAATFSVLHEHDRILAHNRPYSGGYVLERHGNPSIGQHALQLEVDRSVYLDRELSALGPGFGKLVTVLTALVRRLSAQTSILGDTTGLPVWPEAAE